MFTRSSLLLAVFAVTHGCGDSGAPSTAINAPVTTVQPGTFAARSVVVNGKTYAYQVFVPSAFVRSTRWPVVLALHGSGLKGTDNQRQLTDGFGPVVRAQAASFPAVVVFPQEPTGEGLPPFDPVAMAELAQAMQDFNGDNARVYVTGWSGGAILAYRLVSANPARFAAFVPISGDICLVCTPPDKTAAFTPVLLPMRNVPTWIFHGALDATLPVADARLIDSILKSLQAPVRYTEYATGPHSIWDQVYSSSDLYTWMFAQHQ